MGSDSEGSSEFTGATVSETSVAMSDVMVNVVVSRTPSPAGSVMTAGELSVSTAASGEDVAEGLGEGVTEGTGEGVTDGTGEGLTDTLGDGLGEGSAEAPAAMANTVSGAIAATTATRFTTVWIKITPEELGYFDLRESALGTIPGGAARIPIDVTNTII